MYVSAAIRAERNEIERDVYESDFGIYRNGSRSKRAGNLDDARYCNDAVRYGIQRLGPARLGFLDRIKATQLTTERR